LVIARFRKIDRAGRGRSGYWNAASFTLAFIVKAGNALSPYSPFTRAFMEKLPDVFTRSKSRAYTCGTSDRMLLKSVLGARNARSRPSSSPMDRTDPATRSLRSLRLSSV
jgi:hypothetical protein